MAEPLLSAGEVRRPRKKPRTGTPLSVFKVIKRRECSTNSLRSLAYLYPAAPWLDYWLGKGNLESQVVD